MDRRQVIRLLIGAGLLTGSAALLKSILWPAMLDADDMATLEPFADTLLPADELLPAASGLGVPRALAQVAASNRELRRLLRLGLDWLGRTSAADFGLPFASLNESQRTQVVTKAAAAPEGSKEHIFFERARMELFALYYGHPETWMGLPGQFPPQPLGYLDYAAPPRV